MQKANPASRSPFKFLNFLYMVYIAIFLSSIVMVYKEFKISNILLSDATVFFPITFLIGDIVAEVYGYKIARRLIWLSLMSELIFSIILTVLIYSPYPDTWHLEKYYLNTEGRLLRVFVSNILATFVGDMLNIYALSKWKVLLKGRVFWLRSLGSTAIGEATYTLIASSLGFIGLVPMGNVVTIVISTYIIKVLYAIVFVYFGVLAVKFLKNRENIDIYDYDTDFNPFKLEVENAY